MMTSKDLLGNDVKSTPSPSQGDGMKKLENDKRIYILSIVSLFLYIPVGTIMSVFSIVRANEELDEYRINPEMYSEESFQYVRKGRAIGIVSLVLQIASIPIYIILSIVMSA